MLLAEVIDCELTFRLFATALLCLQVSPHIMLVPALRACILPNFRHFLACFVFEPGTELGPRIQSSGITIITLLCPTPN